MLLATLALFVALQAPAQQFPAPQGYVNDFAGVLPADAQARITRIAEDVRAKSSGEIALVTLKDLGGREANDVALRIGTRLAHQCVGNALDRL